MSGYDNSTPKWTRDGSAMIWGSDREATRAEDSSPASGDVYELFFTKAAWDKFRLTKEEFALDSARTSETKLFTKIGAENASMEISPNGKVLFVLADGKVSKISTDDTDRGLSGALATRERPTCRRC